VSGHVHIRVATRRNSDGTPVRYLQLAHNEWDASTKTSRPKVLHSFGREDTLDRAMIERLVASLCRLLDPAAALAATTTTGLRFVSSRAYGGAWTLDALWRRLGIDTVMTRLLAGTRRDPATERVLFALVANRALDPSSKLAAAGWVERAVHIDGLPTTTDDACYRAMDWLNEVAPQLQRQVFDQVAHLLNLEVDLLFFDTTSTYFELDEADEPVARDQHGHVVPDTPPSDPVRDTGFRTWGKSKDHRGDLPQIVVGMAVTRDAIPVRVWCWPGNTGDSTLIRQVKTDMRDWTLTRVVWVGDRGFTSEANRRALRIGDHHYILGEKLRGESVEATAALSRQGRYKAVAGNLRVKEVHISDDERFVVCHNPEAADRDAHIRERLLARLTTMIDGTDELSATKRAELRGVISTKPGLHRYLRVTPTGLLRLDQAAVKQEQRLDGKYLLRCTDPGMSAEDIALGYKQLFEVERGWRTLKTTLDLRPVYHRLEDRIRAHVVLCWLALLLVRVAETTTGRTWHHIRDQLDELHVGTFTGPAGTYRQRTELTRPQRDLLARLDLTPPKKIVELAAASD
jgi:Transposase DDE domain